MATKSTPKAPRGTSRAPLYPDHINTLKKRCELPGFDIWKGLTEDYRNFFDEICASATSEAFKSNKELRNKLKGEFKDWDGRYISEYLHGYERTPLRKSQYEEWLKNNDRLENVDWLNHGAAIGSVPGTLTSRGPRTTAPIIKWFIKSAVFDDIPLQLYIDRFVAFCDDQEPPYKPKSFEKYSKLVEEIRKHNLWRACQAQAERIGTLQVPASSLIEELAAPKGEVNEFEAQLERAWNLTSQEVTALPYENFIKRWPNTVQSGLAERHLDYIRQWKNTKLDDPFAIRSFIQEGPFAQLGELARNHLEEAKKAYVERKVKHVLREMSEPEVKTFFQLISMLLFPVAIILFLILSFNLSVGAALSDNELAIFAHDSILKALNATGKSGIFERLRLPDTIPYFSDANHELAYALVYVPLGCLIFFGAIYFIVACCAESLSTSHAKQEAEIRAYHEARVLGL